MITHSLIHSLTRSLTSRKMNVADTADEPLQVESIAGIVHKRKRDEEDDDNDRVNSKKQNNNEESSNNSSEPAVTAAAAGGLGFGFGSYAKSNPFLAAASKGNGLFGKPMATTAATSNNNVLSPIHSFIHSLIRFYASWHTCLPI